MLMHLEPEKVTSTCPQSFAELDPDCYGRVLGAGESFRGGALRHFITTSRGTQRGMMQSLSISTSAGITAVLLICFGSILMRTV